MKKIFKKFKKVIIIIILLIAVLAGGIGLGAKDIFKEIPKFNELLKLNRPKRPEKKLQIIDLESTTRPVGVMIDNIKSAWPHAGLNDAYLIYEIIVEGGYTRLFALFKDTMPEVIGPVRSLRHYYIDYALENDAVLVRFGNSPKALSDVATLKVANLDGLVNPGGMFWRDSSLTKAPHNAFTSMKNIREQINKKGYNKEVTNPLLNYSVKEIDLSKKDGSIVANNINIKYSYIHTTSYVYDETTGKYLRSMQNTPHKDRITGEQYSVENIIIIKVKNYNLPDTEDKGRQELENIGTGDGYYISNGYAVPIKYEKTSRSSKTKYTYLNGEEISVNDGNTYIQIQPTNQTLTIE